MSVQFQRPNSAFVGASWAALLIGSLTFFYGLWRAPMALNEKGYYFTVLLYGLFAAVAVQKNVRDIALADGATNTGRTQN
jgi:uncharacterized membrane protein YiaA